MKTDRKIFLVTVLLINFFLIKSSFLFSQKNSDFYYAFIHNNPNQWKQFLDNASRQSISDDYKEVLECLYGYIGWCIRDNKKEEGKKYLKQMEVFIDKLRLSEYDELLYKSITLSYGILLGMKNPMINGPKVIRYVDKALKKDPLSPLGYIQKGNALLNMPSLFGGSRRKALGYFSKAQSILEKDGQTSQNWIYMHLLCIMSETYEIEGDSRLSQIYFEKIKNIEPNLFWLKLHNKKQ